MPNSRKKKKQNTTTKLTRLRIYPSYLCPAPSPSPPSLQPPSSFLRHNCNLIDSNGKKLTLIETKKKKKSGLCLRLVKKRACTCEVLNATNFWFNHRKDLDYNFVVTCIYIHLYISYTRWSSLLSFSSKKKITKNLLKTQLEPKKKKKEKSKSNS